VKPFFTLGRVVATPGALAAMGYRATTFLPILPAISLAIGVTLTLITGEKTIRRLNRDCGLCLVYTLSITGANLDNYGSRPFDYLCFIARRVLT